MFSFSGNYQHKLDAKGRVSIPAQFRGPLKNVDGIAQMVLRPSHNHACVEAWTMQNFTEFTSSLDRLAYGSADEEDLALTIFSEAIPIDADREGRIVVPGYLLSHAGVSDTVMFIGLGRRFQLWEPEAGQNRIAGAVKRSKADGLTLPVRAP